MVDKSQLYGEYQRRQQWQEDLAKKGAHKALDIPLDDEMNITVRKGIGWKELAVIAAMVGGGLWLGLKDRPSVTVPPIPIEIPSDSDTLFELHLGKETT